jgi:bifunctional non-homologous end joining protein LigD
VVSRTKTTAAATASLREYRRKRDFARTPEPAGDARPRAPDGRLSYVIQKHAARRLHYDFRLEMDGVLKSWAVPKGPSLDPGAKRLAVRTEDHPIEYGSFEGVIPEREYGGGTVMVWDRGWWEPVGDAHAGYAKGDFKFILHGKKLGGHWVLVRMKGRRDERDKGENWLLIKERDAVAEPGSDDAILTRAAASAASGRDMATIAREADRVWSSKTGEVTPPAPKPRGKAKPVSGADTPDVARLEGAKRAKAAPHLAPQLAKSVEAPPPGDDWLHEIKYDGYRILAHLKDGKATLRSRNDLDWTAKFPELARDLARLPVGEAVLDGEVVALVDGGVSSFAGLQDALSKGTTDRLVYMAFDLPYLDGWDLSHAALENRKALLHELLGAPAPRIRFADHQIGRGREFLDAAAQHGLEGIISKRRDATYRAGRGPSWLKAKCFARDDFVIVGYSDPEGARVGFGALLLGYHTPKGKLTYAGRVGTGFSDRLLTALLKQLEALATKRPTVTLPAGLSGRDVHWVKPKLIAEVSYSEWTSDHIIRQSSFVGLRDDKDVAEVVLTPGPGRRSAKTAPAVARPVIGRDGAATVAGVRITHAERVVYPEPGLSKLAVAEYCAAAGDAMLAHVARRPLSLVRCPEGLAGQHFYQKHPWAGISPDIKRVPLEEDGKTETFVMIEDVAGLLGLAQMGVLEIHPWGSTVDDPERPDRLIFDLDPDEALGWERVVAGAREVRGVIEAMGLASFAKTTGGKGLHVVVPIKPSLDWETAKAFTRAVVERIAEAAPQHYTATMSKTARRGRIFIDYLRNARGSTAVGAYSMRARAHATVSTPLTWTEVEAGVRPDRFTIETVPQRLAEGSDPWPDFSAATRQTISAALRRKLGV